MAIAFAVLATPPRTAGAAPLCEGAEPTIAGTPGADVVTGTSGDDIIATGPATT